MEIIDVIIRWFEGFVAQGVITVRALPDIAAVPVMTAIGLVSLGLFFWIDNYLTRRRER